MNSKILIAGIVVLSVIVIGIVAAADASSSNDDPNVTYNYQVKNQTDSITYTSGQYTFHDDAPAGKTYQPVRFIVKNVEYDKGYGASLSAFKIRCSDGNEYSFKYSSTEYYGDAPPTNMKLGVGSKISYTIVFEIPKGLSVTDIVFDEPSYLGIHGGYDPELS